MSTFDQARTAARLQENGYVSVGMPNTDETPIPGLMLMTKPDHSELLRINPDGSTTDLLQPCGCGSIF